MNQMPSDVRVEAEVAYGGPLFGTLAALITVSPAVALSAALCGVSAWVVPRLYTRRDAAS